MDERITQASFASRPSGGLTSHASRDPAIFVARLLAARLISVDTLREHPHAHGDRRAKGFAVRFESKCPTDGIRTDIEPQDHAIVSHAKISELLQNHS
jgi:hypothetical protein